MAIEPHGAQVQHCRFAMRADKGGGRAGGPVRIPKIAPVAREIGQPRTVGEAGGHPPRRGPGRNPDPVVLADQQERQGHTLHACPPGRIDRALCGRVVQRGIAETGHGNAVTRQDRRFGAGAAGKADAIGGPDRLGQVACDGRGLGRDEQIAAAQHLVPPATGRIVCRAGIAEQHVAAHVLPFLRRTGHLKGAIAIVQKGDVIRVQRMGHRRHAFVPGRADRIKPLARLLHLAADDIEGPRQALVFEQRAGRGRIKPKRRHLRQIARGHAGQESVVND